MPLESVIEKLENVIQSSSTFNNPFNNWIRSLDTPYYVKISLVNSGGNSSRYPCDDRCTILPLRIISKPVTRGGKTIYIEASDGKEDERCTLCEVCPLDIKYMDFKMLKEYMKNRLPHRIDTDLQTHKENEPLYREMYPNLFPPQQETSSEHRIRV